MTTLALHYEGHWRRLPLLLCLPALAAGAAWMLLEVPLVLFGLVAALGSLVLLARPTWATPVFAVILATNAAAVAVRFHGVPFVVGAASPLLLALPVCYYVFYRNEGLLFPSVTRWILGFHGCAILSCAFSERADVSIDFVFTSFTEGMLLFLLTVNAIRSEQSLRQVIWALIASGAALGMLSCYQEATHTYNINYGGFAQMDNKGAFETEVRGFAQTQPRLEGPIGDQNYYAQWMLALVPLGVCSALAARRPSLKAALWLATGLIAAGVALTFSRGAAVGGTVMLVVFALLFRAQRRHLLAALVGIAILFAVFPQYATRLASLRELWQVTGGASAIRQTDLSVQGRTTEMLAAGLAYLEHPLLGVGPGMFPHYYGEYASRVGFRVVSEDRAAHSMLLQIAAELGTVALLCFLAVIGSCLRGLLRAWSDNRSGQVRMTVAALLLALTAYLTTSLFLDYAFVRYLWFLLALTVVAARLARPSDEPHGVPNAQRAVV